MSNSISPLEKVLGHLERVRQSNTGWTTLCPGHADRQPSLSVSQGDDGRVLIWCHAGCPPERVVAAMSLTMADLFVEEPFKWRKKKWLRRSRG